jgi:hypothetical protein
MKENIFDKLEEDILHTAKKNLEFARLRSKPLVDPTALMEFNNLINKQLEQAESLEKEYQQENIKD